jgi:hypothetical protein
LVLQKGIYVGQYVGEEIDEEELIGINEEY